MSSASKNAVGRGTHRADSGVGDHDVEAAEGGHTLVDHGLEGAAVADVGGPRDDTAACLVDQVDGLVEIALGRHRIRRELDVPRHVDTDDVGTLLGEAYRVGAPPAPGRDRR